MNPRKKRTLRVPEPEIHLAKTSDGKILKLTRYKGGSKGPLVLSHGLGVSSLIFAIDTIETNLLEALVAAEYDCWLLDYRASVDLPYARELWTGDDVATKDYPAAVAKVRAVTGAPTVQMLAHCFGATTFTMAMLAGLEGVRSAVISQISTDYVVPWFPQRMLAYLRAPALFEADRHRRRRCAGDQRRQLLERARSTSRCSSSCRCRAASARTTPPATASARCTGASISSISSTARPSRRASRRCSGRPTSTRSSSSRCLRARARLLDRNGNGRLPAAHRAPGAAHLLHPRRQERLLPAREHRAHARPAVAGQRAPAL